MARQRCREGAPRRVKEEWSGTGALDDNRAAGEVGAAHGEHHCRDRGGAQQSSLEKQPRPSGVQHQVYRQGQDVSAAFPFLPTALHLIERVRRDDSNIGVEQWPNNRKYLPRRLVERLTQRSVPGRGSRPTGQPTDYCGGRDRRDGGNERWCLHVMLPLHFRAVRPVPVVTSGGRRTYSAPGLHCGSGCG